MAVAMTCMTTKQKFDVDDPPVVILANGRYAYRVQCPWEGKNGKVLYAFKFCSAAAYRAWEAKSEQQERPGSPESEQLNEPESPEDSPPESPK